MTTAQLRLIAALSVGCTAIVLTQSPGVTPRDAVVKAELSRAVVVPASLPVAASLAKLVCCDAGFDAASHMIHVHGGTGFTWEHPAHRYLKRATANHLLAGDPAALRRLLLARAFA